MEASPPPPATARRDAAVARRGADCTTVSATPPAHDPVPALKGAFRAVRDVCAKFNASIRARYPKSSPLARAVTRGTWCMFGGAPFLIIDLQYTAEDALYATQGKRYRFNDDAMQILYAADEWAEPNRTDPWKRRERRKSVSIVELALVDLIRTRSDALYNMCVGLPGARSAALPKRQKVYHRFKRGLDAVESALKRARKDPEPTYKLLMALRRAVPPDCAARIVEYVA